MRYQLGIIVLVFFTLLGSGCARFPTDQGPSGVAPRTLYSEITVRGTINPADFYFLALNFDATGASGPVPVVAGYGYTNGWGTISNLPSGQVEQPPFYMVFSGGSFAFYRNGEFVGRPVNAGYTGNRLWVEIDQRYFDPIIGANPTQVIQLNWITMTSIDATDIGKSYDGFGRTGREYFNIESLLTPHQWISGIEPAPEEPVYGPLENTSPDADTDMTGWQIEVRVNSGA